MALVDQLVTVGAVMAGAAGSYLTTRPADRDRFKRDLQVRWDERRLDAYAVYVTHARRGLGISGDLVRRDVVSLPAPRSRESQ